MKLTDRIYLVGSGTLGHNHTDPHDCNVYLVDAGSGLMLVDCGSGRGTRAILANIEKAGFHPGRIDWIVVTHHHADHAGGATQLRQATGARIVATPAIARIVGMGEAVMGLDAARAQGVYPADYRFEAWEPDRLVRENERLRVGELTLSFVETPGHSHDHVAVYCPEWKALFSGDLVFEGGRIARQQAADFSIEQLRQSIMKLMSLEVAGLYPGHWSALPEDGGATLRTAAQTFREGRVPESIV